MAVLLWALNGAVLDCGILVRLVLMIVIHTFFGKFKPDDDGFGF